MNVREDFCGLCAAIPMALAGASVSGYAMTKETRGDVKALTLLTAGAFVVMSLILLVRYWGCSSCDYRR